MSNDSRITKVKSVDSESGLGRRFFSFKATQIILLISGILEALIALRVLLKLIGANADSPIVALIYSFSSVFLVPFVGLVDSPTIGGMVLETSSLFAIVVYALVALALERLIWVIFSRPRGSITRVIESAPGEHHTIP